jgi:peptidase M48-like protein
LAAQDKSVQPQGNEGMASGKLHSQEIEEIYWIMLKHSGYDAKLDDQAPWGKPKRGPTTLVLAPGLGRIRHSPAEAMAANTGLNADRPANLGPLPSSLDVVANADHGSSHVFVDETDLLELCQTRGELAFALGHEIAHLVHHDHESLEKFRVGLVTSWFEAKGNELADEGATKAAILQAFEKDNKGASDGFQHAFELRADAEAQKWVGETEDPLTHKPFGEQAGVEFMDAAKKWLDAKNLESDNTAHGSLEERATQLEVQAAQSSKGVAPH